MSMQDIMEKKLRLALKPTALKIIDESENHKGHGGWRPSGETHFRIYVTSDFFKGQSRIQRHRKINDVLADELQEKVHALAIHAQASGER